MTDVRLSRRDALRASALMLGGLALSVAGPAFAHAGPAEPNETAAGVLTLADRRLAEAIADTLLPTTARSPGARAAAVGVTMNTLLTDCWDEAGQRRVVEGLAAFRAAHPTFAALARTERERILVELDREVRVALAAPGAPHWFTIVRELAERAYFTSRIGMTQALRWTAVPGRWIGCVPLRPGQPAWG